MVVGWYHSHPGFGCWLSGVDINTQQSFEQLNPRLVSVVIDPVQSVKGKVVIDAFRLINPQTIMLGQEPRQTTSNLGHLQKPSLTAIIHGLNRHYYSIALSYKQNELEQQMLMNLHKKNWTDGLTVDDYETHSAETGKTVGEMVVKEFFAMKNTAHQKFETECFEQIVTEVTQRNQPAFLKTVLVSLKSIS